MNRQTNNLQVSNLLAVLAWVSGALMSFSATALAVRELAPALGLFDMLAVRAATGMAIVLAAAGLTGQARRVVRPRRLRLHLFRNGCHFLGTYGWSLGLTLLPLAAVFALEFTTPAWVTLLAVLVLRERLTASRLAAVVLGFLGVLVILRPGLEALKPASFIVLAAATCFAITAVATKALTRTEGTLAILFWMNVIQLPLNLVAGHVLAPYVAAARPLQPFAAGHHGLALAVICVTGLSAHWCLTNAYQRGDAILVIPLDFLRLPLIALIGWRLYGEALDAWLFAGAGLIIAGILWNLRSEARAARPSPGPSPAPRPVPEG